VKNLLGLSALALIIGLVVPAMAEDNAKKVADELAAKWEAAYNAGDPGKIASMFASDGAFNPPSGVLVKGKDAIEKGLAGRMKAGWTKETVSVTEAHSVGNAIWAVGDYNLIGTGEMAGKETGGKFGEVLVKEGNDWHLVMLTANVTPPKQ
jgi:uncharacterized protein (TIGR02246 family)